MRHTELDQRASGKQIAIREPKRYTTLIEVDLIEMLFHIDEDTGVRIKGWFVPDNPSDVPQFRIILADESEFLIEANEHRPDMRDLGRHSTGQCGFNFGPDEIYGLDHDTEFEMRDANTDLLIYRRFIAGKHLPAKVLFFELGPLRHRNLLRSIKDHFSMYYNFSHSFSAETLYGILTNQFCPSIFVHGAPNYSRNVYNIRMNNFKSFCILRDPVEDLAEKLLYVKIASRMNDYNASAPHMHGLGGLGELAATIGNADQRSLNASFKMLAPEVRATIGNPAVRALGCDIGMEPDKRSVGNALEQLATMTLVGVQTEEAHFLYSLSDILNRNITFNVSTESFAAVKDFAAQLRTSSAVLDLLEYDIILYHYIEESIRSVIKQQSQEI